MKKHLIENLKLIIVALVLLVGVNYVYAGTFSPAPSNPPVGDVDSFLKTGTDDQVKPGSLSVNAFSVDKMALLSSKVFVNGIVRGYGTPETVHFGDSSNSVAMHAYGRVETTKDFYGNPVLMNDANKQLCADDQGNIVFCDQAQKIDGACGSSDGQSLSSAPTANLCSSGTASSVAGSGPWSWSCSGSNGGISRSCGASLVVACQNKTISIPNYSTSGSPQGGSIAFNPSTNSIWAVDGQSWYKNMIDVNTGTVTSEKLQAYAYGFVSFDPVSNTMWMNAEYNILGWQGASSSPQFTLPIFPVRYSESQMGVLTVDTADNSLWLADHHDAIEKMTVSTKQIKIFPIGSYTEKTAYDPYTNSIWANTTSELLKINPSTGIILARYPLVRSSLSVSLGVSNVSSIIFEPHTNSIWVLNNNNTVVSKYNVTNGNRTDYTFGVGAPTYAFPEDIVFDPYTNSVWITIPKSNTVVKMDLDTGTKKNYTVSGGWDGIAFDSTTKSVWVSSGSGSVSKICVN